MSFDLCKIDHNSFIILLKRKLRNSSCRERQLLFAKSAPCQRHVRNIFCVAYIGNAKRVCSEFDTAGLKIVVSCDITPAQTNNPPSSDSPRIPVLLLPATKFHFYVFVLLDKSNRNRSNQNASNKLLPT